MEHSTTVAGMPTTLPAASSEDENFSATSALVAFLRMEAEMAEEKAKRFRQQAVALARQFGVTEALQEAYEISPDQMPPLDKNGVPKYKGKKRGRKPKARKRKANPNRRKRQHTAYTLFVQETYPRIKAVYPDYASKDVISIVAKKWKHELSPQEKQQWKARAKATHEFGEDNSHDNNALPGTNIQQSMEAQEDDEAAAAAAAAAVEEDEDEGEEESENDYQEIEVPEEESEDEEELVPPARRSRRQRKK